MDCCDDVWWCDVGWWGNGDEGGVLRERKDGYCGGDDSIEEVVEVVDWTDDRRVVYNVGVGTSMGCG